MQPLRPLVLCSLVLLSTLSSGCVVLKEQNIERRMQDIEETIVPLAGQPKEVVLEQLRPLELGEPVRVEPVGESGEEYEFHRRYLSGIGGYDQIVLRFESGLLASYEVRARR